MTTSILENIKANKSKWVIAISSLYIVINAIMTYKDNYWFFIIPPALLIIYITIYHLDKLILMLFFLTPLSINVTDIGLGVGVNFPTEPLFFGLMLTLILKGILEFKRGNKILSHPISIAIIANFIWLGITTLASEFPMISIKFMIARLWFLVSCYFACIVLFKDFANVKRSIGCMLVGLAWLLHLPCTN